MKVLSKVFTLLIGAVLSMVNYAQSNCGLIMPPIDSSCSIPGLSFEQINHAYTKFCGNNVKAACIECRKLKETLGGCDLAKCIYEAIGRKQGIKYDITYKDGKKDCMADSIFKSINLDAHVMPQGVVRSSEARCGDGQVNMTGEQCDDNNTTNNDGCCSNCTLQVGYNCTGTNCTAKPTVCGDGVVSGNEVCDDGNTVSGDGCCNNCKNPEPGYVCPPEGGACTRSGPMPTNVKWNCKQ